MNVLVILVEGRFNEDDIIVFAMIFKVDLGWLDEVLVECVFIDLREPLALDLQVSEDFLDCFKHHPHLVLRLLDVVGLKVADFLQFNLFEVVAQRVLQAFVSVIFEFCENVASLVLVNGLLDQVSFLMDYKKIKIKNELI